jgi:hypothetical protein
MTQQATETATARKGKAGNGGAAVHALAADAVKAATAGTHAQPMTYVDTALAALCNAYSYAQSMAYQEEVFNQQRWEVLIQAAFSRTMDRVAIENPTEMKEQLALIGDAISVFQGADERMSSTLAEMSSQFKDATALLIEVKARAGLE